jgi:hypothetical protein
VAEHAYDERDTPSLQLRGQRFPTELDLTGAQMLLSTRRALHQVGQADSSVERGALEECATGLGPEEQSGVGQAQELPLP